jgi:2'-5' RNA ligase
VFWIGIEADENLRALAEAVDTALSSAAGLGIERERQAYTPHLTLARASQRASGNPHQKPRPGARAFGRLREKLGARLRYNDRPRVFSF